MKYFKIYEKDFEECFVGHYSVGTNGKTGGDRTITEIEFNFVPGGNITIHPIIASGLKKYAEGDSELQYFIEAFEWMAGKLKKSIEENKTKEAT